MSRNSRAWLAYFAIILAVTCINLIAGVEVLFLTGWAGMLIWQAKIDWRQPWSVASRISKIVFTTGMMCILGFCLFITFCQLSDLLVSGNVKMQVMSRMKDIASAMKQHDMKEGSLPKIAIYSVSQQPLLSWRVHLLPYLGEEKLYQRFRLNEPWNSEHNLALLHDIPKVYQTPSYGNWTQHGYTRMQLITGPGAVFERGTKRTLSDISYADGLATTILLGFANHAVPWTKPEDMTFVADRPIGLGPVCSEAPGWIAQLLTPPRSSQNYQFITADGTPHSRWLKPNDLVRLNPLVTWNGGEPVDIENIP